MTLDFDSLGRTIFPLRYRYTTPAWLEPFRADYRGEIRFEVEHGTPHEFRNNTTAADAAREEG